MKDIWNAVQAQREKEREDILLKQKQRQISSINHLFTKVEESIMSDVKIDEIEVINTGSEENTSAIRKETEAENVNEVNIKMPEKAVEVECKIEETKVEASHPVKKEKTSFLQNGGIFPKIKINRRFSKTKSKDKVCSVVTANENDTQLEEDIEKLDLNKIENKINTKKNPSEVWC